jgi:hypothetical protein
MIDRPLGPAEPSFESGMFSEAGGMKNRDQGC